MAEPNGSGVDGREEDGDSERTQRMPATKGAVETWFSDSDRAEDQPPTGGC